jgi:hypothetical protein
MASPHHHHPKQPLITFASSSLPLCSSQTKTIITMTNQTRGHPHTQTPTHGLITIPQSPIPNTQNHRVPARKKIKNPIHNP